MVTRIIARRLFTAPRHCAVMKGSLDDRKAIKAFGGGAGFQSTRSDAASILAEQMRNTKSKADDSESSDAVDAKVERKIARQTKQMIQAYIDGFTDGTKALKAKVVEKQKKLKPDLMYVERFVTSSRQAKHVKELTGYAGAVKMPFGYEVGPGDLDTLNSVQVSAKESTVQWVPPASIFSLFYNPTVIAAIMTKHFPKYGSPDDYATLKPSHKQHVLDKAIEVYDATVMSESYDVYKVQYMAASEAHKELSSTFKNINDADVILKSMKATKKPKIPFWTYVEAKREILDQYKEPGMRGPELTKIWRSIWDSESDNVRGYYERLYESEIQKHAKIVRTLQSKHDLLMDKPLKRKTLFQTYQDFQAEKTGQMPTFRNTQERKDYMYNLNQENRKAFDNITTKVRELLEQRRHDDLQTRVNHRQRMLYARNNESYGYT